MAEDDPRLARLTPAQRQLYERRLVEKRLEEQRATTQLALQPRCSGAGPHALSFPQERFWFLDQLEPGSAEYNVTGAARVRGRLDVAALERALTDLVARQASLRTTFPAVGGRPGQLVRAPMRVALPIEDLRNVLESERENEMQRRVRTFARRPFDLAHGPLFRVLLLVVGDDDHVFVVGQHHSVSDGWSLAILVGELSVLYRAHAGGRGNAPTPLPIQYADYSAWQRERMVGAELERLLAHWRATLEGAPASLALPFDHPRGARMAHTGRTLRWALDPDQASRVRALAASEQVTPFVLLLASFQGFLARISGEEDVVVGTSVANRTRRELEGVIGAFVNTLVLRTSCADDPTFRELAARARATTRAAFTHAELPFEALVAELAPVRDPSRTPLFNVYFDMAVPRPQPTWVGLSYAEMPFEHGNALFDLGLSIEELGGRLHAEFEYSTELFDPATMERMQRLFSHFLGHAVASPDTRLSRIHLLDAEERALVLDDFNATDLAYDRGEHAHVLLARRARLAPDAIALEDGAVRLTYAELDARANQLAHALLRAGAKRETRIAVCLPRSIDAIVALYGVWKSGAAYVPLDVEDPPARWIERLDDVGAITILAHADVIGRIADWRGTRIALDANAAELRAESPAAPHVTTSPDTLAYVLYTSGSTGRPKGVMIEHGALANHLAWVRTAFDLASSDRFLLRTPFTFDASLWEIVHPLACGATLVVARQDTGRDPSLLLDLCARARISILQTVPSLLRIWLEEPRFSECTALRHLICAGEALDPDLWKRFDETTRAIGLRIALHNLYGPSEATIDATWHTLTRGDDTRDLDAIPIGRPISNARAYVLDARGEPVPIGIVGELWLGGDGLGRGYWNDPELTAQRFVTRANGLGRLYRTGDLGRWLTDGTLVYVGRADRQLKVNGVRVEPGEIESELRAHPDVRDAAVVALRDEAHGLRMQAFVVPVEGHALDTTELRAFLSQRLPRHLVPAFIVALDALPLTTSLKTDLRALQAIAVRSIATSEYESPRTETEALIAELAAALLGVARVGRNDDFFALGGHSLLAARLVARVRESWRVEFPLARFFERPNVNALATIVDEALAASGPKSVITIPRVGGVLRQLSFAQEGLWIAQRLEPESTLYNVSGGLRLRGSLDTAVLERALARVLERHEILRSTFEEADGMPRARVHSAAAVLARHDLSTDPLGPEAALRAFLEAESRHFSDLQAGPLIRVALLRLAERDHVLALDVHHLVADGWSLELFVTELARGYAAGLDRADPELPPLEVQYADWAEWQRAQAGGERETAQLAYWRTTLAGAPPCTRLPVDRSGTTLMTHAGATLRFALERDVVDGLRLYARERRTSLYPVLAAALAAVLHRISADDDIVIGTVVGVRPHSVLESVIGPFVNVLPLRIDVVGNPDFNELVRRFAQTTTSALEHGELPFERIAREFAPVRTPGREPFVNVSCDLQSFPENRAQFPGLTTELVHVDPGTTKLDLSLTFEDDGRAITGYVQYSTELFERRTIEAITRRYTELLRAALAAPSSAIATLDLGARDSDLREAVRQPDDARAVVIGGRRVRPSVVESVLADHPHVRAAFVEARLVLGELQLVAHLVAKTGATIALATIDAHVRGRLAAAWIPSIWRIGHDAGMDHAALSRVPLADFAAVVHPLPLAPRNELEALLHAEFAALLQRENVGVLDDFFALGGSSLSAMRLVAKLRKVLHLDLALGDFYAAASIAGVAQTVRSVRAGVRRIAPTVDFACDARLGSEFPERIAASWNGPPRRWLLTGATGYLGAFLLRGLLDRGAERVHCLVRASSDEQGVARLRANLERYELATDGLERVRIVRGDLGEPDLGLDASERTVLGTEVDAILHSGAAVNFLADYARLRATNVLGTRALLEIASRRGLPFHHISTIGVYAPTADRAHVQREDDPLPRPDGLVWGYEQTKWVAEQLVLEARARGLDVTIHRPGRISGSARNGVWNLDDFAARMMRGCVSIGVAPALDVEIDMTPVDWVANAIVHLAMRRPRGAAYHLANPRPTSFLALFERLRARGARVRVVPLDEWFSLVRAAVADRSDHVLAPLLEMIGAQRGDVDAARLVPDIDLPKLDSTNTARDVIDAGVPCPAIDDSLRDIWIDYFARAGAIDLGAGTRRAHPGDRP